MDKRAYNYKDLDIWKRSFELCVKIYAVTNKLPKQETYGLRSQLNRAAVSVPSNIAEGYQSHSKASFLNFLYIAKGSLAETETQLLLVNNLYEVFQTDTEELLNECTSIAKMLNAFISYLKQN